MAREFLHAVDDKCEAITGIEEAIAGKTFEDYQGEWMLRHAIQRAIEIISEASRALPDEAKAMHPEIPWPNIRAIGNVLRHEYHGLSDRIIWNVVTGELPRLKAAIQAIQRKFDTGGAK